MSQSVPPPPPISSMPYATPGMEPTRTSAAAVTSLICGVLGCFVITGIIAIITGIIGLRATRDPQVKGRGLAIAGLVLGILTTIGGAACLGTAGVGLALGLSEANKGQVAIDGFLNAASQNDVDAAMKFVDASFIKREEAEPIVNNLKDLGPPKPFSKTGFSTNKNYGSAVTVDIAGSVEYPKMGASRQMSFVVQKQADGTYKLIGIHGG